MSEYPSVQARHATKSRGRRVNDAKDKFIAVRCTAKDHAAITEAAAKAGLSVGAFLRTQALGDAGPRAVRRPPIERKELARLLGWLGKHGSNVNQLAHAYHRMGKFPGFAELVAIRKEVAEMREALMKALGRDH
jgi:hypothetical protein